MSEPRVAAMEKARALLTAKCVHDGGPACRCVECMALALEDFAAQAVMNAESKLCAVIAERVHDHMIALGKLSDQIRDGVDGE